MNSSDTSKQRGATTACAYPPTADLRLDSEELTYAYDAVGRVTSMTDYHGATTEYDYDIGGRLTTILAPGSKEWYFEYNDLGQPTLVLTPNGPPAKTSKLFQCNLPGGQGQGKINPNALVETYGYDSRNRLTRRYLGTEVTGGVDLEEFIYALDNAGNITKTTELDGTVWDYEYDDRYRLTLAEAAVDGTKAKWKEAYTYDDGDNLLTKTTPVQDNFDDLNDNDTWSGHASYVATKGYLEYEAEIFGGDFVNAMAQSEDDFQAWFSFSYAGGATADISLRNASPSSQVQLSITDGRLTLRGSGGILDTDTISTPSDLWYEYYVKCDGADVEVWRREKGTTDALVKVLETDSATDTSSSYFSVEFPQGNYLDDIVFLALNGDTLEEEVSTYNAANELTGMTVNGESLTFTYDQFGRMTQKTGGGKTADYYYHYGDKLTKVASNFGGEGTVTYTVGGDQKRRSRAVSGGDTTKYRYGSGWDVLNEESGAGTLEATYVHHPGKQIGTVLATSAGTTASTGTWAYYFQDAIGSTRGLWDEEADRIGKYDYTPFGGKYSDSGEDITRKFTGHDWDSAARLYYTAYRYYSPDSNRWLTRDPLGMVDGPNVYAYVVNNPVSLVDVLGGACSGPSGTDLTLGGLAAIFLLYAIYAFLVGLGAKGTGKPIITSLDAANAICAATILVFIVAGYAMLGAGAGPEAFQAFIALLSVAAGVACIGVQAMFYLGVSTINRAALIAGASAAAGYSIYGAATTFTNLEATQSILGRIFDAIFNF